MRLISTKASFPLLKQLEEGRSVTYPNGWRSFTEEDTPNVNRDVIGYFAVSVFWRASVHVWKWADNRECHINLGAKYNEAIRRYLLGEAPFPQHVHLFIVACTDWITQDVFFMPVYNDRLGSGFQYSFSARGIAFMMQVGKYVPEYSRKVSCMTKPERFLFAADSKSLTMQTLARFRSKHADYDATIKSSKQ
jgi:hypothetical protein